MPTPFRIRERLMKWAGLKPPDKGADAAAAKVSLVVSNGKGREQSTEANVGQTVLLTAGNLAAPIASGCSDSSCSTCRIEVVEGEDLLSARSPLEVSTLKANNRPENLRLACVATVTKPGDLKVRAFEFLE